MPHYRRTFLNFIIGLIMVLAYQGASFLFSQDKTESSPPASTINWQECPCIAKLGDLAEISLPEGYSFAGREGTIKFMEINQNPTSGNELGVVLRHTENGDWFVVFEFEDSGYVKDDEKDELDADALLSSIRKGTDAANEIRKKNGWSPLNIKGWQSRPFYDQTTNNLTWAIKAESVDGEVVNHSVRLLGRSGVMHVDLVLDPQLLDYAVPEFNSVLRNYKFSPGHRYSEFRRGDKLAEYGLTALIAGGAGAVAAKTGLLAKFWKLIVAGILALGAMIKKFFSSISNRGVEKAPELPKED